jgi:hypothetical protein
MTNLSKGACTLDLNHPTAWLLNALGTHPVVTTAGTPSPPVLLASVSARGRALLQVHQQLVMAPVSLGSLLEVPNFVPTLTLTHLAPAPAPVRKRVTGPAKTPRRAPSRPVPPKHTAGRKVSKAPTATHRAVRPSQVRATGITPTRYPSHAVGFDISWPQCGSPYPGRPYAVAIVGVNDGWGFTLNPCLASEAQWAGTNRELYLNLNSPTAADARAMTGPAGHCPPPPAGSACAAYNFGWNDAAQAVAMAGRLGVTSAMWWIDVETGGSCAMTLPTGGSHYWSCFQALNALTVQGGIDALRAEHRMVGIYTTGLQWSVITGGYRAHGGELPTWVPGVSTTTMAGACSGGPIPGGRPWLLQFWPPAGYDFDFAC